MTNARTTKTHFCFFQFPGAGGYILPIWATICPFWSKSYRCWRASTNTHLICSNVGHNFAGIGRLSPPARGTCFSKNAPASCFRSFFEYLLSFLSVARPAEGHPTSILSRARVFSRRPRCVAGAVFQHVLITFQRVELHRVAVGSRRHKLRARSGRPPSSQRRRRPQHLCQCM